LRFRKDMRSDERRKRLCGNELNPTAEPLFEKFGEGEKTIECLSTRQELHQQIDVAIRSSIAMQD